MTRDQAIRYLSNSGFSMIQIDTIVKALEQEPTTKNNLGVDLISRADVIRAIEDVLQSDNCDYDLRDFLDDLADIPSVTPQEPKTGHWIESDAVLVMGNSETDNFLNIPAKECSVCHKPHIRAYGMDYCPNCGAKMAETEDT